MIKLLSDKIDSLTLRLFMNRWSKRFNKDPKMIVPFVETMTRWAELKMTSEEIEKRKKDWKSIIERKKKDGFGF